MRSFCCASKSKDVIEEVLPRAVLESAFGRGLKLLTLPCVPTFSSHFVHFSFPLLALKSMRLSNCPNPALTSLELHVSVHLIIWKAKMNQRTFYLSRSPKGWHEEDEEREVYRGWDSYRSLLLRVQFYGLCESTFRSRLFLCSFLSKYWSYACCIVAIDAIIRWLRRRSGSRGRVGNGHHFFFAILLNLRLRVNFWHGKIP